MNQMINREFECLFYLNTSNEVTRIQLSDAWSNYYANSKDVIIKTTKGFILKSNLHKETIINTLKELKNNNIISEYIETNNKTKKSQSIPTPSYAAAIQGVERDITDEEISTFLTQNNIQHRFCKRITSRATGKQTTLIRNITEDIHSYEKLLNEGMYFRHRHYPVYTSPPPPPIPIPCSRCLEFSHTTEKCTNHIICTKCSGAHPTDSCKSTLPIKCTTCQSEEHQAWSVKCPKHPTGPIEGIPNVKIKPLNKPSLKIDSKITKTYVNKLNKKQNVDRQQLIDSLKKRFIDNFQVDTMVVFSGSRIHILMFDLEIENSVTATQPIDGIQIQYNG